MKCVNEKVTNALVNWISKHCCPINIVEDDGLREINIVEDDGL